MNCHCIHTTHFIAIKMLSQKSIIVFKFLLIPVHIYIMNKTNKIKNNQWRIHIPYMKELYTHMSCLIPVISMGETCTGFRSYLRAKRITSYSSTDGGRLAIITSSAYISGSSSKQRNIVFVYIDAVVKLIYLYTRQQSILMFH